MGSITPITRTPATTVNAQAATATPAITTKVNPVMATNVQSVKLKDVSSYLFDQLVPGEICRFGAGWITRCPECESLVATSNEFKTFGVKNKETWRLAPSLSCPNDECSWHRSVVIEPEQEIDTDEEETIEEEISQGDIQ